MPTIAKFKKLTAWSYSRYTDWLKCPLMCAFKHITHLKEPPNAYSDKGNDVHDGAERYATKKIVKLPKVLANFKTEFNALRKQTTLLAEQEWAFTKDWERTDWRDWNNAWLRVKMDAHYLTTTGPKTAQQTWVVVIDYKSGKIYDDHDLQRSLYALGALLVYPDAVGVVVEHWYTDQGIVQRSEFRARDLPKLKAEWHRRTKDMLNDITFPPRPSPSACRFCHFRRDNGGPCKFSSEGKA